MGETITKDRVPDDIDLFDPRVFRNGIPYDGLARLRAEHPVAWHDEPAVLGWPEGPGFWAVTRYDDVQHVSKTPEVYSAHLGATQVRDPDPEDLPFIQRMMLNMDPPEHTRLRQIVNKGFTPRTLLAREDVLRRYAREIVDAIAEQGGCDFAEDVGADYPLLTLTDVMGVPREDRRLLYEWTNRVIGYQDDEYAEVVLDPRTGKPVNPRSPAALEDMFTYAQELAEHKRRHPGDDLITRLLEARVDGERLSDAEFQMMFFLFTVAGNDTTHSAVPGGMLALLDNPDQLARLQADLGLLPDAIEEMLRFSPPVIHFRRTATRDVELRGQQIARGEKVVVFYPAANRDPEVFGDPDRFDITRWPNKHLTFGIGPHFCLGNYLARLQIRVMFEELLTRLTDFELAGDVQRLGSNFINGIKHMPMRFRVVDA